MDVYMFMLLVRCTCILGNCPWMDGNLLTDLEPWKLYLVLNHVNSIPKFNLT